MGFNDRPRLMMASILFAMCPIFWLFQSLHMRDAAAMFCVILYAFFWLHFLSRKTLIRGVILAGVTVVATLFFHYLRGEFSVVPVAMVLAASAAMLVAARGPQAVVAGVIIGLACVIWVLSPQGYSNITDTVAKSASYAVLDDPANGEARQSLGKALVVNQPLPIRAVVGSAYLWVFPVPFWHGFFTGSLYHILKSLHAVFAFFLIPAMAVGALTAFRERNAPKLFLVFCIAGFTVAVAITSLETRHLGVFLPLAIILACTPDYRTSGKTYARITYAVLAGVVGVHLVWAFLRFW